MSTDCQTTPAIKPCGTQQQIKYTYRGVLVSSGSGRDGQIN